jgi:hypothetical protein
MKKSFIAFALLSLIVTGIVAGCAPKADEGAATPDATKTEKAATDTDE